jgi:hypothetical protein
MAHETLDLSTKMYVDRVHKNENTYEIQGWIFSTSGDVERFIIGDREIEFSKYLRPDVRDAYPSLGNFMIGFKTSINIDEIDKPFKIQVKGHNVIINVLQSFKFWIVYYSGFNRDHKDLIVVDNFYANPDLIRDFAMTNLEYKESDYHKGRRTKGNAFIPYGTKEKFEKIIGRKITNWNHPHYANGVFQYCTSQDPIVYHVDTQTYAAMVFLTPNAPVNTGTAFYKSKYTGATIFENVDESNQDEFNKTFKGLSNEMNFYDSTQYELMDEVANVYNRLVLFNSKRIHAATKYFGDGINNARFFQLFFFDVE